MAEAVQNPEAPPQQPARPAQPLAPQPIHEKVPLQHPQPMPMQFIPFDPQQQQPLLNPDGEAIEPKSSKKWHITKIVLGSMSIVASIILWAIAIVLLAGYTSDGDYYDSSFQVTWEVAWVLTAAGLAILWQAAEFITVWASPKNRGIHPGANVGLHLIIWLVALVAVGFLATFVTFDIEQLAELRDPDISSNFSSHYQNLDQATLQRLLSLEETLLAFTALLVVLHFVLFVRACVETHRFNSARGPVTRTVYVQVPVQMPGGMPGQQPVGYYAYQPLPGQPLPFAVPPPPHVGGGGAPPVQHLPQAHLYGYYAPAPVPGTFQQHQQQVPVNNLAPTRRSSNRAAAGGEGSSTAPVSPSAGTVSPVTTSDRQ